MTFRYRWKLRPKRHRRLSPNWGVSKYMNPALGEGRILKYEGYDKEGYATFSTPSAVNPNTEVWNKSTGIGQCWYASVGIKYMFN